MQKGAVALHINNRNEEALEDFNKALALDPENPYRYASRAFFRDRIGDYQGALEDYEITISLDPDDAIAINNVGAYFRKKWAIKSVPKQPSKEQMRSSDTNLSLEKKLRILKIVQQKSR